MRNFLTLCRMECHQIAKSLLYYLFIACILLFYVTQMGEYEGVTKPIEGAESYGYTYSQEEQIIMEMTTQSLFQEYLNNQYQTYPFGFLKNVVLGEEKQEKIEHILERLTGEKIKDLKEEWEVQTKKAYDEAVKNGTMIMGNQSSMKITPLESISFTEFCTTMEEVDQIIGGGSAYRIEQMKKSAYVPKTYEQALAEYEEMIHEDGIGRAYARQFCDYMGILLAILPVFMAVARALRDKRAKAMEVIDSKRASASSILISRYVSTVVMILLPLCLIAIFPTMQTQYSMRVLGVSENPFTLLSIVLWWLTPTILVTVSVGFFFTELTHSTIAILIQAIWWFLSINSNQGTLTGLVGYNLIPRFNSFGAYQIYQEVLPELIRNRILYSVAGILLLAVTILVYTWRRKGGSLFYGALHSNRKN